MSLIRDPKNVWCHMMATEHLNRNNIREFGPGEVQVYIYDSAAAAAADLKGFVKSLREGGHKDIYDFTGDAPENAEIAWTDAWTGKRMRRWVTDLPFFHG